MHRLRNGYFRYFKSQNSSEWIPEITSGLLSDNLIYHPCEFTLTRTHKCIFLRAFGTKLKTCKTKYLTHSHTKIYARWCVTRLFIMYLLNPLMYILVWYLTQDKARFNKPLITSGQELKYKYWYQKLTSTYIPI